MWTGLGEKEGKPLSTAKHRCTRSADRPTEQRIQLLRKEESEGKEAALNLEEGVG